MFRSYALRIRPNKSQSVTLEKILEDCCETYNAALQERIEAWKLQRKRISYRNQQDQLSELRKDPIFAKIAYAIQVDPLRRLDRAFNAFFRRCKNGEKPGFPRFKPRARYKSFTFSSNRPRLYGQMIGIPNVGKFRFKSNQKIEGLPISATVKREGNKWLIKLICDIGPAPEKCAVSNPIGIDLGLTKLVTLSDGATIDNPRWKRKHECRIAKANRALTRKRRGSNNRIHARETLRRAHQRATDARRNFLHHVSKWLVANYDLIAFEKLNIKGLAQGRLAKSILDAAWGELIWQITYKAESAGKWAIPVNPKGTSIRCSQCGADVRKTLAERRHVCACGANLDRDHNAALNVLALGHSAAGL
jgi:putative transposase